MTFYEVFERMSKEMGNGLEIEPVTTFQMCAFEDYGIFLNRIDPSHQEEVAHSLIAELYKYNFACAVGKLTYDNKDTSKKHGSALKTARKFRNTLKTFDETFQHVKREDLISLYEDGEDLSKYFTMVELVDEYIEDLQKKEYNMAPRYEYRNTIDDCTKIPIMKLLKKIVKDHNIKGASRDIPILIRELNEPPQ